MEFFNEDPVPSERITDENDVFTMDTAIAGNIKKTWQHKKSTKKDKRSLFWFTSAALYDIIL